MIAAALALALGAGAAAPLPLPRPAPAITAAAPTIGPPSGPFWHRPPVRPAHPELQPQAMATPLGTPAAFAAAAASGAASPLPRPRPPLVPVVMNTPQARQEAMVCRDPRLTGDPRPDIVDTDRLACGIDDPVSITSIAGIRLSQPALLGCPTARRLADWLTGVVRAESLEQLQSPVTEVWVMGSYACRNRNNVAGGRLSEHARGRAVDIGGFTLANGQRITVARDWGSNPKGDFLRRIWRKGCGAFHTVLGPNADRHHHDHLHLDTSPRGGEPYCR